MTLRGLVLAIVAGAACASTSGGALLPTDALDSPNSSKSDMSRAAEAAPLTDHATMRGFAPHEIHQHPKGVVALAAAPSVPGRVEFFGYSWNVQRLPANPWRLSDGDVGGWTIADWVVLLIMAAAVITLTYCSCIGVFCLIRPEPAPKADGEVVIEGLGEYSCSTKPPTDAPQTLSTCNVYLRRSLFFGLVHVTGFGAATMLVFDQIVNVGFSWQSFAMIATYTILVMQLSVGFWVGAFGFCIKLFTKDARAALECACPLLKKLKDDYKLQKNVAILLPIYNEDPRRVLAGLEATMVSLIKECETNGLATIKQFEFHILSDTRKLDLAEEELSTFDEYAKFCEKKRGVKVFYRRRLLNTNKKVGNIAEFLDRAGDNYEYQIIFDADSIMSGAKITQMARLMEVSPRVGIIQSQCMPVRQRSLYGRMQQFAATCFGEMLVHGYAWMCADAGTYIGHNAIMRVHAFKRSGTLPMLPGKAPLGGHILSHDHVEAAVMRAAGWEVWFLPSGDGSYEEMPTNLIDMAARDFRWLTGELQHLKLTAMPELPAMSRYQLTLAATHYLGGICWILQVLLLSFHAYTCEVYPSECPNKPLSSWYGLASIIIIVVLLFGSKPLMLILIAIGKEKQPGGVINSWVSMCIEVFISTFIAPMLAIIVSFFTMRIMCGQGSGWDSQDREGKALTWWETIKALGQYALIGLPIPFIFLALGSVNAFLTAGSFFGCVMLTIPLAKLTSSPNDDGAGEKFKRCRFFLSKFEEPVAPETLLDEIEENLKAEMGRPSLGPTGERATTVRFSERTSMRIGPSNMKMRSRTYEEAAERAEMDRTPVVLPTPEQRMEAAQQVEASTRGRMSSYRPSNRQPSFKLKQ